jgi:ketosteroid isomerase-like protein
MATKDVAEGLVRLCKEGKFEEAIREYYSEKIVSVEPSGDPATVTGIAAVIGKAEWWHANFDVHSMEVSEPYVNGHHFAVRFILDATFKPAGKRSTMDEIALYTVEEGKIVHEMFLFGG